MLAKHSADMDVVILHDPELLLAAQASQASVTVWDVHEDTAAALTMKSWIPAPMRGPLRSGVEFTERRAERKLHLMLAETSYSQRFSTELPVVPNSTWVGEDYVPCDGKRAIAVGMMTRARGALDLAAIAPELNTHGIQLDVVGPADAESTAALTAAHDAGHLTWHGFLPNDQAMALVDGAAVGLSLLHNEKNYQHSMPTKVMEYLAHGVPVVTTALPLAAHVVNESRAGLVVPFNDPDAAITSIKAIALVQAQQKSMASNGFLYASQNFNWSVDGPRFVRLIEEWADQARV